MSRPIAILGGSLAVTLLALAAPGTAYAQEPAHPMPDAKQSRIPESIRVEHAEIHAALIEATRTRGEVGSAARALAAVLHPHFVREEQIALPPLSLLAPLARGEATPAMRELLPMTDSLRAELPRMLEEHVAIRSATVRLGEAARAARNAPVVELTEKLKMHAQQEEELLYPAAVLVGDLVRARTEPTAALPRCHPRAPGSAPPPDCPMMRAMPR